ncbi:MAG: hypothetical protein ACJ74O_13760 [Frankiaceae bacterium]
MTTPWTGYDTIVTDHRSDLLAQIGAGRRRAGRSAARRDHRHRTARHLHAAAPSACA